MATSTDSCEHVSVREVAVVLRLREGSGTGGVQVGFSQRLGSESIAAGPLVSALFVSPLSFSSSRV